MVPPSATQRLEQGGGITKSGRLRLDQGEERLLIGLFRAEQDQVVDVPARHLRAGQVERFLGGALCLDRGGEFIRVRNQRVQGIGDVLISGDDGAAVLRRRLIKRLVSRPFAVQQRAAPSRPQRPRRRRADDQRHRQPYRRLAAY